MKVKVNDGQAVTHNDRLYQSGEEVDLPKESADRLIDQGVVSEVKTPTTKKTGE
jgi:hypothetical protein